LAAAFGRPQVSKLARGSLALFPTTCCRWQANPYFAAGRVTVPALLDTFACQSFFNEASQPPPPPPTQPAALVAALRCLIF
jgi:hypothetical protein